MVARVTWNDADAIQRYGKIVVDSLKPFGGKYLARGPIFSVLEGADAPARLAVVEFPSLEQAKQWHESEAYKPALAIRAASATTHWIVLIDGVDTRE